jgi:isopentenyl diphosphate isomerase/L-lactate dehydrogenase-like FMN-dependent dehydrogenase
LSCGSSAAKAAIGSSSWAKFVLEARDVVEALRHVADAGADELVLHADGAERKARVGVPSPVVVVAVAVQMLRPAGHVRIPLIPRLKMSFQQAP